MIEVEYKKIITKEQYDFLANKLSSEEPTDARRILQVNYYYDTPQMHFNKSGVTIRIRQTNIGLKGTVKEHLNINIVRKSKETDFNVTELPEFIRYNNKYLFLKGQLVTDRLIIPLDEERKITLMLDRNYYLGSTDYEMEMEFADNKETEANEYIKELEKILLIENIPLDTEGNVDSRNKSERFFNALNKTRRTMMV